MELGPFYTGQIPSDPLTLVVRDSFSNKPVDLSAYTGAAIVVVNPEGVRVPSPEGPEWAGQIANPTQGEVRVPLTASPFLTVGDHQVQLLLRRTGAEDLTSTLSVEVYRRLGG